MTPTETTKSPADLAGLIEPAPSRLARIEEHDDDGIDLPSAGEPGVDPIEVAAPSSPKPRSTNGRANGNGRTTARRPLPPRGGKPSPEMAAMLPPDERIWVYYREKTGELRYVSDYTIRDIRAFGTLEAFLKEYAVPEFGYGEYEVMTKTAGGDMKSVAKAGIKAPLDQRQRATPTFRELVEMQEKMTEKARQEANAQNELMLKMLDINTRKEGGGSMDPMTMMLLMKTMEKPAAPAQDPAVLMLAAKLDEMERMASSKSALPPMLPMPPPPPPAPNPMETLAPFLTMMVESNKAAAAQAQAQLQAQAQQTTALLQVLLTPKPERDTLGDLVKVMQIMKPSDDGLKTRDILELLPTFKEMLAPKPEKDAMTTALEQVRMVQMFKEEFGLVPPSGGGSTFWDMLNNLVSNVDLGGMAAALRGGMAQQQQMAPHAAPQAAPQQAPQSAPQESQAEGPIEIPEAWRIHGQAADAATEGPVRVTAILQGLRAIALHKDWREHVGAVLRFARANDKQRCLDYLGAMLSAMSEAEAIEAETVDKVIDDFDKMWVLILKMAFKMDVEDPGPYVRASEESDDEESDDESDDEESDDEEGAIDEDDIPAVREATPLPAPEPTAPALVKSHQPELVEA